MQPDQLRRREFITLIGGGVVAWPLAARAQPATGTLRLGVVSINPRSSPFFVAFEQRLVELGYQEGKNFVFSSYKSRASRDTSQPAKLTFFSPVGRNLR
jgi:hypothetical protein